MNRSLSNDELNQIKSDIINSGFKIVRNFLDNNTISELKKIVEDKYNENIESQISYKGIPERDSKDRMVYSLQNLNKKFVDLISSTQIESILKPFLNDKYYRFIPEEEPNYILNYFNARSSGNKLDLHIDSHIPYVGKHIFMMQVVFLLEKSKIDNGCTIVVPGSHNSGKYTDRSIEKVTFLEGEPGDMIIWDSRIWHGTTENITSNTRWAIISTFSQWWVKQANDIPKGLENHVYKSLTDKQKQLLGFLSLPPKDPNERVNTKCGYDYLKNNVNEF
jgi:ectoine hydroxylase-related dioxygenase (phytanoyl-CoA dioxygenase family)